MGIKVPCKICGKKDVEREMNEFYPKENVCDRCKSSSAKKNVAENQPEKESLSEIAKLIMKNYDHFGIKAEQGLKYLSLSSGLLTRYAEDVPKGLEELIEIGYLAQSKNSDAFFFITRKGSDYLAMSRNQAPGSSKQAVSVNQSGGIAGENVYIGNQYNSTSEKKKWFPWKVLIGISLLILLLIIYHDKIDFEKTPLKALDRFGIVELKDSSTPFILGSLQREYKQNLKILKDIAYDQQYITGKMGAQLWDMAFSAYDTALSTGIITDVELAKKLQGIYTGVFIIADNAMKQTRTADTMSQIGLYKLIAQNFKSNETFLEETLDHLEDFMAGRKRNASLNPQGASVASADIAMVNRTDKAVEIRKKLNDCFGEINVYINYAGISDNYDAFVDYNQRAMKAVDACSGWIERKISFGAREIFLNRKSMKRIESTGTESKYKQLFSDLEVYAEGLKQLIQNDNWKNYFLEKNT